LLGRALPEWGIQIVSKGSSMRIGVTFPQSEITADPAAIRAYTQAAEDLGYTHLLAYDHVLGADLTNRPDWRGPYNVHTMFHEPFVLFGYMAAIAPSLEFVTNIIILPQRQTALVAKQAAEVDVLSGGKFRLGIGVGWNEVEYQALGESFGNRGRRSEEQIEVLRALFTQESVTFHGRWHTIEAAGINPLPVQRPLPLWLGGGSEATLRRIARLGDGWFPQMRPEHAKEAVEKLHAYIREAGRDPKDVGIEARLSIGRKSPDEWARDVELWREAGATHLGVNTMNAGLTTPQEHIDAIRRVKETLG
jgi:probable F420-dependent oxidoreductase